MCIGMCISIPPSIPHFGKTLVQRVPCTTSIPPWVPLPRLPQLIRLTFLAFVACITSYLTIRLGTSPRPQATFIFLVVVLCVVELWNDSSCQFTINSFINYGLEDPLPSHPTPRPNISYNIL